MIMSIGYPTNNTMITQKHAYHLVDPSPWPLFASFAAGTTTLGGVLYLHSFAGGGTVLALGVSMLVYSMFVWWRDIVREATFQGHHTRFVQVSLRYGMILFIVSEVFFFIAFFWAFFHSSLAPTVEIGAVWPPRGIEPLNPWGVPFVNTVILLSSGAAVTWAHHALLAGLRQQVLYGLLTTILLACVFTALQVLEYGEAPFTISDGIYGSTFYLATGFHGLHVIIGTLFLSVCLLRHYEGHSTSKHHFGFEAAAWYWHFVDVVWLFLFVSIYWWGGL
jgi:cytochrome c oxidase subunit 3